MIARAHSGYAGALLALLLIVSVAVSFGINAYYSRDAAHFKGVITEVNDKNATDGPLIVVVDRTKTVEVNCGYCTYPDGFGYYDIVKVGDRVEVYARKEPGNQYSLIGSRDYYLRKIK